MNYKISTYVLLVVLAGVVIYSCGKSSEGPTQTLVELNSALILSDSLAEDLKALGRGLDRQSGELIKASDAKKKLKKYQTMMEIECSPSDPKVIYGYSFGMEKFLTFADSVKTLDSIYQHKLKGVRVYLSIAQKLVGGSPQFYQDV